jgi:hypothetical protein
VNKQGESAVKLLKQNLAVFLSWCLVLGTTRVGFADQTDQPAPPPVQAAQQTPEQLQQLVAPIALYPDALMAQILAARLIRLKLSKPIDGYKSTPT